MVSKLINEIAQNFTKYLNHRESQSESIFYWECILVVMGGSLLSSCLVDVVVY